MRYSEGSLGRVFFVRVDHGEDMLGTLRTFIAEQGVSTGIIHFIGALAEGRIVTRPEKPVLPPEPSLQSFSGGWDVLGIATITPGPHGPHLHYHASAGRGRDALTGCLREKAGTFIIIEAVVFEIIGTDIRRRYDPITGMDLPFPEPRKRSAGNQ